MTMVDVCFKMSHVVNPHKTVTVSVSSQAAQTERICPPHERSSTLPASRRCRNGYRVSRLLGHRCNVGHRGQGQRQLQLAESTSEGQL